MSRKIAVITGASQGLGLSMAKALIDNGYLVESWDLTEAPQIEGLSFQKVNVASESDVKSATDKVISTLGVPMALVCNAGITKDSLSHKMTTEQFDQVVDVNLKGTYLPCRYLGTAMRDANSALIKEGGDAVWRRILTVSSVAGLFGNVGQLNYSATKAGVVAMAKTLAKEWGRFNISVSSVAPGVMNTEMTQTIPQEVKQSFIDRTPLQRIGEPEELADFVAYLCSKKSAFLTGDVIAFSGGLLL